MPDILSAIGYVALFAFVVVAFITGCILYASAQQRAERRGCDRIEGDR